MAMNSPYFKKGLKDGIPICLGYLSVSFAFGVYAVSSGLTAAEALLLSLTNVTSAGQMAGVPIIVQGGTLLELAACQLVINLRYALMSVSLSQKLDGSVTLRDRLIIAFMNTDEVFAVASRKQHTIRTPYMLGLITLPYLGWAAGTLLGAAAGDVLPALIADALGVAIYGMFIAIVVPAARHSRPTLLCALLAAGLGCCFRFIPALQCVPEGFVIIICAVAAAAVCAVLFPFTDRDF